MKRRILSLFLATVLTVSMLPQTGYAREEEKAETISAEIEAIEEVEKSATDEIEVEEIEVAESEIMETETAEIEVAEIDTAEIDVEEKETAEIETVEIDATETETAEIDATEMETTETKTTDDSAEITSSELEEVASEEGVMEDVESGETAEASLYDYTLNKEGKAVITAYRGSETVIKIPSSLDGYTVCAIGDDVFNGNGTIREVVMPDTVESLGYDCFGGCYKLEKVTLSKNLKSASGYTFGSCTSLTEITIPKGLESSGYMFAYCTRLKKVTFEEGTTKIPYGMFGECSGIEEIVFPDTVTEIGIAAFTGCGLKHVTLPLNLETIGGGAFSRCKYLETITCNDKLTTIGDGAFSDCPALKNVRLSASLISLPHRAFSGCTSLESIIFPDKLLGVGQECFKDCTSLKEVDFGKGFCSFNLHSFENCGFTEITIPNQVRTITSYAFYNCDKLTKVNLPEGGSIICQMAFANCDNLSDVAWPQNIWRMELKAFADNPKLQSVSLLGNPVQIGDEVFSGCENLKEVTIAPTVQNAIPSSIFDDCSKLTVYGVKGSYAETFARENGATFVNKETPAEEVVVVGITEEIISVGERLSGLLVVHPYEYTDEVYVTSSNADSVAASYDKYWNQLDVTGLAVGTSTVTVRVGNATVSLKVRVVDPVTAVSLNKTNIIMVIADTAQLKATVTPTTATIKKVNWTSSDTKVAKVSSSGLVTAVNAGEVVITATSTDGSNISASCSITVLKKLESPTTKLTLLDTGVKVSWNEISGADGYYVYRKEVGGTYAQIATVRGKRYYLDKTAVADKEYYYAVKAFDTNRISGYNSAKIALALTAPTTTAKATADGVEIGWNKITGVEGYRVYRKAEGGSYEKIATVKADKAATYLDATAVGGKKYYYAVKAYVEGKSSGIISANVIALPATPTPKITYLDTGVKVSWNVIEGAEGYYVYRKAVGGTYEKIATVSGKNYFLDKTATPGKQYYYTVKAYANGKVSGYKSVLASVPKR